MNAAFESAMHEHRASSSSSNPGLREICSHRQTEGLPRRLTSEGGPGLHPTSQKETF